MNTKFIFFIRCLILLAVPSPGFAQSAQLQPSQIYEGDVATLVVEYINKIPSLYAIDTSELEGDFEVLGVDSRVFRISEAGETSNRMQWKILISPRRAGNLSIPSLKLGSKTTPILTLTVEPQTAQLKHDENVMVNIEARPENPYVYQQTDITLRLMHNVAVTDGRLFEPEVDNVTILRSGGENSYRLPIDDESFYVVDRLVALFAKEPGRLELSPANFRGQIASTSEFSASRSINRYSNTLQLQVREPPVEFTGQHWLPARQIEISQQWQEVNDQLVVGDSISRRLKVIARGLRAEVLPDDLLLGESNRFKVYADQAKRQNDFVGKDLTGELTQYFEIVLAKPGVVELPELRLRWWDVDEDIEKEAVLPGRMINVAAATSVTKTNENSASTAVETEIIPGLLFYLLLVLALLATAYWYFSGDRSGAKIMQRYRQQRDLKNACISIDARVARMALLGWAKLQWPQDSIVGLHQVMNKIDSAELSDELAKLDQALFSANAGDWRGERLYHLLMQHKGQRRNRNSSDPVILPALYPR